MATPSPASTPSTKAATVVASNFPRDGSTIDLLDKHVSALVFRCTLPAVLEYVLSLPGCFFGMPAFHVLAPLLICCGVLGKIPFDVLPFMVATAAVLIGAWAHVNSAPRFMKRAKLLYGPPALILSPLFGRGVLTS